MIPLANLKLPDPAAPPFCDGRTWRGGCRMGGSTFIIELFPAELTDHYHYSIYREKKDVISDTDDPLPASAVKAHLTLALMLDDLHLDDLAWEEITSDELVLRHEKLEE